MNIEVQDGLMAARIQVPESYLAAAGDGLFEGLLGNLNGDRTDDLMDSTGSVVTASHSGSEQLDAYIESCKSLRDIGWKGFRSYSEYR